MVTLYGDSIGAGLVFDTSRGHYTLCKTSCARNIRSAGCDIHNHSVIGATIDKGLKLFDSDTHTPGSICAIEFGGNDCDLDWQSISEDPVPRRDGKNSRENFEKLLRKFIDQVQAARMVPCVIVPPPIVAERFFDYVSKDRNAYNILRYLGKKEAIFHWHAGYSERIYAVIRDYGCDMLDFRKLFLAQGDFAPFFCPDGIHPNEAGHQLMTEYVLEEIRSKKPEILREMI